MNFSLFNHTSCMALCDTLFVLFCSNWPFQFKSREKVLKLLTSHVFCEKEHLHKKEKSKSVFWSGKGCKTSSGTLLTDTDGHSTSKYCLAHQNTFLHYPDMNFSKCWLFLAKRSQLWWEPGTGKKKGKMECTFKKVGSAIFFIINTKSENKLFFCGKYHPLI